MVQKYDLDRNIFQKHPVPGVDLLLQLLRSEITTARATDLFQNSGVKVSRRTIERHIKKIKEKVCENTNSGLTGKFYDKKPKPTDLVNKHTADLMRELRDIEKIDYSKIKDSNPVKILDKNMMKLELMLTRAIDTRETGAIIELEMKLAEKLHKMRPVSTEINLNEMLSKLDLTTSFIDMFNENNPDTNIKVLWLNFLLEHQ